jgi:hypothetical protein
MIILLFSLCEVADLVVFRAFCSTLLVTQYDAHDDSPFLVIRGLRSWWSSNLFCFLRLLVSHNNAHDDSPFPRYQRFAVVILIKLVLLLCDY